eukprot:1076262-Lingulodinium_polyedra.AAC.1
MGSTQLVPFAEVSSDLVEAPWQVVSSGQWGRQEHIVTLEGRALVHAAKHVLRDSSLRGHRMLFLTDSLVCACSMSKGRSSRAGLSR